MTETRYPAADWNPGANAGYSAGHNQMRACVAHYTVGVDSAPIGRRGFFHFLVSRDGYVQQFAEVDAITWHAGEWNNQGPGVEVEYLEGRDDAIFAAPQRDATAKLIHWIAAQGIPLVYYDGPRKTVGTYAGFISHRSLIQTEEHYDYWPVEDWQAMVNPPVHKEIDMFTFRTDPGGALWLHSGDAIRQVTEAAEVESLTAAGVPAITRLWTQAELDAVRNTMPSGGGTLPGAATVTGTLQIK